MDKEIFDIRKEEIINVCEKLYETNNFKDITNLIYLYRLLTKRKIFYKIQTIVLAIINVVI